MFSLLTITHSRLLIETKVKDKIACNAFNKCLSVISIIIFNMKLPTTPPPPTRTWDIKAQVRLLQKLLSSSFVVIVSWCLPLTCSCRTLIEGVLFICKSTGTASSSMCYDKEGDRFPDTPVSSISHVTGASLINQSIPFCPTEELFPFSHTLGTDVSDGMIILFVLIELFIS